MCLVPPRAHAAMPDMERLGLAGIARRRRAAFKTQANYGFDTPAMLPCKGHGLTQRGSVAAAAADEGCAMNVLAWVRESIGKIAFMVGMVILLVLILRSPSEPVHTPIPETLVGDPVDRTVAAGGSSDRATLSLGVGVATGSPPCDPPDGRPAGLSGFAAARPTACDAPQEGRKADVTESRAGCLAAEVHAQAVCAMERAPIECVRENFPDVWAGMVVSRCMHLQ